jgi:hypothetical protein
MGKIPRYEQGSIASAAVGTPGVPQVDTSQIELFKTIGNAAAGVQGELVKTIAAQRAEELRLLHIKQTEARTAARELETAERDSRIGVIGAQYNADTTMQEDELKNKYYNNTTGAMEEYQGLLKKNTDAVLAAETEPLAKAKLTKHLAELNATKLAGFSGYVQGRRIPIIESNIKGISALHAANFRDPNKSLKELDEANVKFAQDNYTNFVKLYGGEADAKMQEAQSNANVQNLYAIANTGNVEELEARIKYFGVDVDTKDSNNAINKLRSLAAAEKQANEAQRKTEVHTAVNDVQIKVAEKVISGTVKLSDLYEQKDALDALRKQNPDLVDNAVYNGIISNINKLETDARQGKADTKALDAENVKKLYAAASPGRIKLTKFYTENLTSKILGAKIDGSEYKKLGVYSNMLTELFLQGGLTQKEYEDKYQGVQIHRARYEKGQKNSFMDGVMDALTGNKPVKKLPEADQAKINEQHNIIESLLLQAMRIKKRDLTPSEKEAIFKLGKNGGKK